MKIEFEHHHNEGQEGEVRSQLCVKAATRYSLKAKYYARSDFLAEIERKNEKRILDSIYGEVTDTMNEVFAAYRRSLVADTQDFTSDARFKRLQELQDKFTAATTGNKL